MAKLVAQSGPTAGREFTLSQEVTALGRQSTQDVQIIDNMASRAHCQIRKDGRFYTLVDLGSRNGTQLNGRKVTERLLCFGDRIRVGEVEFLLVKEPGDVEMADLLTKYELKEKLGEGGMGIVYKAVQKSMAREVALKILAPRHAQKPKFVDQFIAEARAAGKLNHHHLIQVHDVSSENDLNYFSMEFVEGPTAMDMLRRQGAFQVDEAIEIIRQVSRALAYAHDHRLIHQDIKPDNIMIGTGNVVKLADLGISKSFEEAEAEVSNAKIMGTPAYMAPEAALGKRIDHRVDIYSLGATFFHLLTAKTPYSGPSPTDVLKAHVTQPVPSPRSLIPELPESVDQLVQRMMAKDPEARPSSAAEVEKALDALDLPMGDRTASHETNILKRYAQGTLKSPARDDTPDSLATTVAPPRTWSLGMIGGVVALVVAGGAAAAFALRSAPAPAAPTPNQAAVTTPTTLPETGPVTPKMDAGRIALEAQLSELEGLLSKPIEQLDVAAVRTRIQALPTAAPQDLLDRRESIVRRLTAIETLVMTSRLLDQFATVRAEAQSLSQADRFDEALAVLNEFPGAKQAAIVDRIDEARQEIQREKKAFITAIQERAASFALRKDLTNLRRLKAELPASLSGNPVSIQLNQAIKTLENERQAVIATHLAAGAKDFREWNFRAVSERASSQKALLAGTPAEAQFQAWQTAGSQLDLLCAALAKRLTTIRQQRYHGSLAGVLNPDLMSADRDQGLELLESNGGAIFLRWGKLSAKDLQAITDLLLPKTEADTFRPAIASLGQAAQAK